jgi:hypothetical protein
MFVTCIAGCVLLVWQAKLFVTLSQRSNVETLTNAFFMLFFAYLAGISWRGAWGACKILYFVIIGLRLDFLEHERRKAAALQPPRQQAARAAVNFLIERVDQPGDAFELQVADQAGDLGRIKVEGVRIEHLQSRSDGSCELIAYFVEQVRQILGDRCADVRRLDVVEWGALDDEATEKFVVQADFARRLARHLGADELWPKVTLTPADCGELIARLRQICPALRYEGMLPAWEYSGEHKLPIIPEPLGIISLGRSESRVDALASMGAALAVVLIAFIAYVVIVIHPPWVPGA